MTEDPNMWPTITEATLRAQLTATTNKDDAAALKRGLAMGEDE